MPAICSTWRRRERVERDDLVDPVEELGQERLLDGGLHPVRAGVRRARGEAEPAPGLARAQVRRHHDDGVGEVDRAALAVGQPPVVHQLEQDVPDLGVGLLDLVEQDHRVGPPAHRLGQLAALAVPDVAGGRADQPRHRVGRAELRHVDPDQRLLGREQPLGERLDQLGLADAGRAEEQERAERLVAVRQPDAGAPHGVGDDLDGLLLADHPRVQVGLEVLQPLQLAGHQLAHRDPGARGDDGRHVGLAHDGRVRARAGQPLLQPVDVRLDLRRVLVGLGVDRGLLLGGEPGQLGLELRRVLRAAGAQAHPRGRLVDQVDRLVRQAVLGDVAVAEPGGGDERLVGDRAPVVRGVDLAQPAQDLDRVLHGRLLHGHGREAARQRAVALDLAVLGQRGGADHPQLAAGEHRLQHVRGVHRALGAAGPQDRVQLVDEDDDAALGVGDLREHGLQPLLELAAVLRAGDHAGQVQRDQAGADQRARDLAARDAQGQALDDGGLADAGLADQHGVVLAPPGEDLDRLLDLAGAADHGIDPARTRVGGQVAPELVERRGAGPGPGLLGGRGQRTALGGHQLPGARLADHGVVVGDAVGGHDPERPGTPAADGTRAAGDGAGRWGERIQGEWLLMEKISVCPTEISPLTKSKRDARHTAAQASAPATRSPTSGASLNRLWPATIVMPGRRSST